MILVAKEAHKIDEQNRLGMKTCSVLEMCHIGKKVQSIGHCFRVYVFHLDFRNEPVMFWYYKIIKNICQKYSYYVFSFDVMWI